MKAKHQPNLPALRLAPSSTDDAPFMAYVVVPGFDSPQGWVSDLGHVALSRAGFIGLLDEAVEIMGGEWSALFAIQQDAQRNVNHMGEEHLPKGRLTHKYRRKIADMLSTSPTTLRLQGVADDGGKMWLEIYSNWARG